MYNRLVLKPRNYCVGRDHWARRKSDFTLVLYGGTPGRRALQLGFQDTSNIYKVKNPIYQDYIDIKRQYDENLIVITNTVWEEHPLRFIGGIVRYYGDDRKKLIDMWGTLNNSDKYGDCLFKTLMTDRGVHIHGQT